MHRLCCIEVPSSKPGGNMFFFPSPLRGKAYCDTLLHSRSSDDWEKGLWDKTIQKSDYMTKIYHTKSVKQTKAKTKHKANQNWFLLFLECCEVLLPSGAAPCFQLCSAPSFSLLNEQTVSTWQKICFNFPSICFFHHAAGKMPEHTHTHTHTLIYT